MTSLLQRPGGGSSSVTAMAGNTFDPSTQEAEATNLCPLKVSLQSQSGASQGYAKTLCQKQQLTRTVTEATKICPWASSLLLCLAAVNKPTSYPLYHIYKDPLLDKMAYSLKQSLL